MTVPLKAGVRKGFLEEKDSPVDAGESTSNLSLKILPSLKKTIWLEQKKYRYLGRLGTIVGRMKKTWIQKFRVTCLFKLPVPTRYLPTLLYTVVESVFMNSFPQ